jgi:inorganic triphosphatase YgiF
MTPTETEATLVIVSDSPEQVADAVAALDELGGYALVAPREEPIHDRYLDTPGRELSARDVALRIREVDGRPLLTIKGPATAGDGDARTRAEHETDWPDAWELLRAEVGQALDVPDEPPSADPLEALTALGLEVVQERRTARRLRDVVPPGDGAPVAELAVDEVAFELGAHTVRHHEVEIEAKGPGGEEAIDALAGSLAERYAPSLRPWTIGKLGTGKAIAALLDERGPETVLGIDGKLQPWVYDAIAEERV